MKKLDKILSEFYDTRYSALIFFASKITGDDETAKDIIQDCLLRCFQNCSFESVEQLSDYIKQAVRCKCLTHIKKEGRNKERFSLFVNSLSDNDFVDFIQLNTNIIVLLHAAINNLPAQQKKVMTLMYMENKDYAEICTELKMNRSTCRNTQKIAVNKIKLVFKALHINRSTIDIYFK